MNKKLIPVNINYKIELVGDEENYILGFPKSLRTSKRMLDVRLEFEDDS